MVRLMGYSNKLEGTSHDTLFYCMTIDKHRKKISYCLDFLVLWESSENQLANLKKIRKSNSIIEKMLDPHLKSSFILRFKKI